VHKEKEKGDNVKIVKYLQTQFTRRY
jgi:hypothetical protein